MHPFTCGVCLRHFCELDALRRHVLRHKMRYTSHKSDSKHSNVITDEDDPLMEVSLSNVHLQYECIYCKLSFQGSFELTKHMQVHTKVGKRLNLAPVIHKSPSRLNYLKDRQEIKNRKENKNKSKEKDVHQCTVCHIVCKSAKSLSIHSSCHGTRRSDIFPRSLTKTSNFQRDPATKQIKFVMNPLSSKIYTTKQNRNIANTVAFQLEEQFPETARVDNESAPTTCQTEDSKPERQNVQEHLLEDTVIYACNMCNHVTRSKAIWVAHQITHHKPHETEEIGPSLTCAGEIDPPFTEETYPTHKDKCPLCKEVYTSKSDLQNHMSVHSELEPFKCSICGKHFKQLSTLSKHEARHLARCSPHALIMGNDPPLTDKKCLPLIENKCPQCREVYTSKSDLQNHMRVHSGLEPFKCSFCGKHFKEFSTLSEHEASHLARCAKPLDSELKCEICALHFKRHSGLTQHARSDHPGYRPFKCQICDKKYMFLNDLVRHNRSHTGERPFVCSYCPKAFTHKKYVTRHEKSHTGQKSYQCKFCPKKFSGSDTLTYHERTHTGVKPYTCQICGKSFITNSGLKYHERSAHDTEKPYKCTLCTISFGQKSDLTVHTRTHTGDKPFKCDQCDKAFITNNHLSRHVKTHDKNRVKTHECVHCAKTYLEKRYLIKHIAKHHVDLQSDQLIEEFKV